MPRRNLIAKMTKVNLTLMLCRYIETAYGKVIKNKNPRKELSHSDSPSGFKCPERYIGGVMNIVECGYCKLDVDIDDRHPEYLRTKGISIPLYLHRSCGTKINNINENVWHFHKLSATYINKQNNTAKLF